MIAVMKKKNKLILATILLSILIILFLFCRADAKKPEFKPLYQDSTGWFISKAISGPDVLAAYKFTPEGYQAIKSRGATKYCPAQLPYLFEKCPSYYYLFFLAVPDDIATSWNAKSMITLRYVCGKDTLTLTSTELFFATTERPNRLVFTWALEGNLTIPNSAASFYSEQEWKDPKTGIHYSLPAVFAKFPFKETPDKLLSCGVDDVVAFQKAVSFK